MVLAKSKFKLPILYIYIYIYIYIIWPLTSRLYDRLYQQQGQSSNASKQRSTGIPPPPGVIEPMAKDLVDEETDCASSSDYGDTETSLFSSPAGSLCGLSYNCMNNDLKQCTHTAKQEEQENVEILPSIEELTKSMQDLTEKDLDKEFGSKDDNEGLISPKKITFCCAEKNNSSASALLIQSPHADEGMLVEEEWEEEALNVNAIHKSSQQALLPVHPSVDTPAVQEQMRLKETNKEKAIVCFDEESHIRSDCDGGKLEKPANSYNAEKGKETTYLFC